MKKYVLSEDLAVFGTLVKSFPDGIGPAFEALANAIPDGRRRAYYGLSNMDTNGHVTYYATSEQKFPGEAEKYGFQQYIIPRGEYITATVDNWRSKLASIKDVFHELMQDERADCSKPCIEWYKDDNEMMCMLQLNPWQELFAELDVANNVLLEMLRPLDEEKLNAIPFKDSWTPAQLATHVTKSNKGIVQAMDMPGKTAGRKTDERVYELKKIFLDFTTKLTSPDFIVPKPGFYEKETIMEALKASIGALKQKRKQTDLTVVIAFPAFGAITKLELLHFVLYHTQRHIHQLKNIVKDL